jgi:ribosome maturation factor RimP
MGKIAGIVTDKAEKLALDLGLSLWHVEYGKEPGGYVLRIIIDKPGGVTTEDCEAMSKAIDPWLDEADPISDSYTLEVSSPGVERVLHNIPQMRQYIGTVVTVKLYRAAEGRRVIQGCLSACEPDVKINCDGNELVFSHKDIAQMKIVYTERQGGDLSP